MKLININLTVLLRSSVKRNRTLLGLRNVMVGTSIAGRCYYLVEKQNYRYLHVTVGTTEPVTRLRMCYQWLCFPQKKKKKNEYYIYFLPCSRAENINILLNYSDARISRVKLF